MLPPLRDRIYLARRAARLGRLRDRGLSAQTAERAIAAWEAEAALRGVPRDADAFWDAGEAWIAARSWR